MQRRSGSGEARTLFLMHQEILLTNNETYLFYFYGNTYYTRTIRIWNAMKAADRKRKYRYILFIMKF